MTDIICKVVYQVTTGRYPSQELVKSAASRQEANDWIKETQEKTPVLARNKYSVTPVHFAWIHNAWRKVNATAVSTDFDCFSKFNNSVFSK